VIPGARLVVLGKQGAGKGTQCVRLSRHYVVPHIATGDMLRAAVRLQTPLGLKARHYLEAGDLLPDELMLGLVAERLVQDDTRERGFVFDGFPRTVGQAQALEEILGADDLDLVLDLEVPTTVVLERLSSRRVCTDCGAIYSASKPPAVDWTCDECGGEVVQRSDDTEEAIYHRLQLYEEQTAPLVAWYEEKGKLVVVDGVGPTEVVSDRLTTAIDGHRLRPFDPLPARPRPTDTGS
jgi:adenylate kinase